MPLKNPFALPAAILFRAWLIVVLHFVTPAAAIAETIMEKPMTREEIYASVQQRINEADLFAGSTLVLTFGKTAEIVSAYESLIADAHHKAKSTEQVIHFGHAGVNYAFAMASITSDETQSKGYMIAAKRMATNVASFTWPAWQEPGITVMPQQCRDGLQFARMSVRLAAELELPVDKQSFTGWFLGAQLIANGLYDEAITSLAATRVFAQQTDNAESIAMLDGYAAMAVILKHKDTTEVPEAGDATRTFDAAVAKLNVIDNEDAAFYAKQLVDVRRFFERQAATK